MSVHFKQKLKSCVVTILENVLVMDTPLSGAKLIPVHYSYTHTHTHIYIYICKCKVTAIQLQAWTGPEGSRRLKITDFKTIVT